MADTTTEAFADRIFAATLGALDLATIHLGSELGLYPALRDGGPATSRELASRAGIDERYAREWLEQQAAAGILECLDPLAGDGGSRRFALPDGYAVALCDEEHPGYVGGFAASLVAGLRPFDAVVEAFRTGRGVPFAAYDLHDAQASFSRPMFANDIPAWITAMPGIAARLAAGETVRVADVGCGEGWFAIHLALAYPSVEVDAFDLDDASIAAARRLAAARGVADRVHFEVQDVAAPDFGRTYDLVTAFEMLHDVSDPVGVLRAMDRVARPDGGIVLVVDEKVDDDFAAPADDYTRMLYGFSVLHCLPVGRDVDDGHASAATGTVMRPSVVRAYAREAGLDVVEVLDVENDFFRFYRMR